MSTTLFTPTRLGELQLKNRIVMAPLARWRGAAHRRGHLAFREWLGLCAPARPVQR